MMLSEQRHTSKILTLPNNTNKVCALQFCDVRNNKFGTIYPVYFCALLWRTKITSLCFNFDAKIISRYIMQVIFPICRNDFVDFLNIFRCYQHKINKPEHLFDGVFIISVQISGLSRNVRLLYYCLVTHIPYLLIHLANSLCSIEL